MENAQLHPRACCANDTRGHREIVTIYYASALSFVRVYVRFKIWSKLVELLRGVVTISTWKERMGRTERRRRVVFWIIPERGGMFYLTIGERDNEALNELEYNVG